MTTRARETIILFACAAVWFVALGQWYTSRLRVSGDEPHYLLMAQSLWREQDLDLSDNLAREDWREYTPGPVAPHFGAPRADGRPFPAHSAGLPFLLAPVYALGGRRACAALIGLMAAALVVETLRLFAAVRPRGADEAADPSWRPAAPAFGAAAVVLGPPVAFYSFHVYTEVPAALALTASARILLSSPSPGGAALAALLASALPWLHVKIVPAAAALAFVAAPCLRGRTRVAFAAVAGLMAAGYLGYFQWIYGVPTPLALYGGLPPGQWGPGWRALAGLLLDRSFGALWYAPILLLALAGLFSRAARGVLPLLLIAAAVLGPAVTWRMWWGGQCPPGRFLVPLMPVLAVLAALRIGDAPSRGLARWRVALAGAGIVITVALVADPGRLLLLNRADRPTRLWVAIDPTGTVARALPSLVFSRPDEDRVAAVWMIAIAALLALDAAARRLRAT